ncbi:hypothetical protein [Listeria booriae]|uniref:hypothetical protein n=1 Tax=Listeria booriae TaxID=1552123 RepID=UPI001623D691|nr:hypothetical protein [Listeria booriae]MBC2174766.1 hypothetical protein [Listeria booriae]
MTVGELIEELSKYDANLPVGISDKSIYCVSIADKVEQFRFDFGLEAVVIQSRTEEAKEEEN